MSYRAKQGDIIKLNFDPQIGNEQMGRRPALVISNKTFNNFTKKGAMVCPITHTDRGLRIQVKLDGRTKTQGVVMCDQAKILDLSQRNTEYIESAPMEIILDVIDIINGFIEIEG
ncbi:MAG: type II toxin-antitoxin system PemK/MazF family toxin [Clostridiales bacterium]|jgi:mRNA interferase MazF|nr:type II toxin-antitoxin system PemK/MazF family toxin [Clostridiales bacterium]